MESKQNILSILKEQQEILCSWGFSNEILQEDQLLFTVKGFCFKGKVIVIFNRVIDSFTIRLEDSKCKTYTERTGILLDDLVNTIDGLVEKNCSQKAYKQRVFKEYEGEESI